MNKTRIFLASIVILPSLVFLSSCIGNGNPLPLPEENSIDGVLHSAEISLLRRGTHVISKQGVDIAYIESSTVNLRSFEGQQVTLSGSYQYNTEPAKQLPVFVAVDVTESEVRTTETVLPEIDITVEIPHSWIRKSTPSMVHFHLDENEDPIVTLYRKDQPDLKVEGVSIVVDGKPAIRISDEQSDSQIVHVLVGNDDVLTLMLFIPEDQGSNSLREDWLYLLSTLVFDDKDSSLSNSVSSGSGSINGMPCGGPAGILCPDGKYCDIYDIESDIGRCVSL